MRRSILGMAFLAVAAVSAVSAGSAFAARGPVVANSLCAGGAPGTAACNGLWIVTGACAAVPDPCGAGIGTATNCDCTQNPVGAPAGCYCHAS
jgi:hypothetical protein